MTLGPVLSKLQATVLECLPGTLMSRDNLASMQKDNVCDCPFPAVFGIAPDALEAIAPEYLAPSARRSRYDPYRASAAVHRVATLPRSGPMARAVAAAGADLSRRRFGPRRAAWPARSPIATTSSSAPRPRSCCASGFRPVGRDFPVFLHPETQEEHALARTERKHGRGYRGFEFFASPRCDARGGPAAPRPHDQRDGARRRRRAGRSVRRRQPISRAGVLRHVSPAFAEDPLRVLRVARFAARFGFVGGAGDGGADARDRRVGRARDAVARAGVAGTGARADGGAAVADAGGAARLRRAGGAAARSRARCMASRSRRRIIPKSIPACILRWRSTGRPRTRSRCRRATRCSRTISARRLSPPAALPRHIAHEQRSVRHRAAAVRAAARSARMPRCGAACGALARRRASRGGIAPGHAARSPVRRRCAAPARAARHAARRMRRRRVLAPGRGAGLSAGRRSCARRSHGQRRVDAGAIARAVVARTRSAKRSDDAIAKAVRSARLKALRQWRGAMPRTSKP